MSMPPHSRLINAAAKAALRPLGCVQKGRSRTWLDDHGWWVGVVEFQPSSWSKGSYLNVGVCWLWYEKDHLSFDDGYRIETFQEFHSEEQYLPKAEFLAKRAAEEVMVLRQRFSTTSHVQAWLAHNRSTSVWSLYHRAVSAGLSGALNQSRQLFGQVIDDPHDVPWAITLKQRCKELLCRLEEGAAFQGEVTDTVKRTRLRLGLPALDVGMAEPFKLA
ncbi:MAG: DUF4304 domain-containing protein [Stenotrophomonas sp.]|uniref:DUF4304 domain-containing protein n=1 Tax=Stenotrophomonas sp. TaxID=69392 RepID=UPI003D6CC95E